MPLLFLDFFCNENLFFKNVVDKIFDSDKEELKVVWFALIHSVSERLVVRDRETRKNTPR
jgi:hypothetical protein